MCQEHSQNIHLVAMKQLKEYCCTLDSEDTRSEGTIESVQRKLSYDLEKKKKDF